MGDLDAFVDPEEGLRIDEELPVSLPFDLKRRDLATPERDVMSELLPAARAAAARRERQEQNIKQGTDALAKAKSFNKHPKARNKSLKKVSRKPEIVSSAMSNTNHQNETRSLLSRYNDVPDYRSGAYHPRDFNYHRAESCGPRGEGTLDESFFQNGIICDFAPYEIYSKENPATDEEKAAISNARRKACNCEVERKLTREHMKALGSEQDLYEHVFPLNKATMFCKQCAQIERDILSYGYLRSRHEIERNDAVIALMLAMHELNKSGEEHWKECSGVTRFDKITRYLWDVYLPRDLVLKNIKKNMPFSEFRRSLAAVDIFLREKALHKELEKHTKIRESKLSRYETRREKIMVLDKRRQTAVRKKHQYQSKKQAKHGESLRSRRMM